MIKNEVKIGYALALLDIAKEEKITKKIYLQTNQIIESLEENEEFVLLLDGNIKLSKKEMGHRLRFYQSELDQLGISKGLKYKELKKSIIIFICTYDPFGKGAGRYTFEETCQEQSSLILDDGATKIIYNTLGILPESDKNKTAIENFFNYVNGEQPQDDFCKELAEEVRKQHQSTKKKGDFLMWEQIICEREEAAAKEAAKVAATEKSEKMAIKMLKGNEPVSKIAEYTELALSKIQELANKNGYTLVTE